MQLIFNGTLSIVVILILKSINTYYYAFIYYHIFFLIIIFINADLYYSSLRNARLLVLYTSAYTIRWLLNDCKINYFHRVQTQVLTRIRETYCKMRLRDTYFYHLCYRRLVCAPSVTFYIFHHV